MAQTVSRLLLSAEGPVNKWATCGICSEKKVAMEQVLLRTLPSFSVRIIAQVLHTHLYQ
jgi:hypothetical protein